MFVLLFLLPLSFAIEPKAPQYICDERMIPQASIKKNCDIKAKTLKLDTYAATACNAINDDGKFLSCWQSVAGGEFNPDALGRCVEKPDDTDDAIMKCILSLKNKRVPASVRSPFQSLSVPGKKKK